MATDNDSTDRPSVDECLRALEPSPDFEPDLHAARARLRERHGRAGAPARRISRLAALGTVTIVVLALPWTRAVAERVWDRLTVNRIQIVQISGRDVPGDVASMFTFEDRDAPEPVEVPTVERASQLAGFVPALPSPSALPGTPRLSVLMAERMWTRPVDVTRLRAAVGAAGLADTTVPDAWHGARLVVEGGPAVVASYETALVEVMQARPFRMNVPAEVPLEAFMRIGFRLFGRSRDDARSLAHEIVTNPAVVFHFPEHHHVRDLRLRDGRGVVVGDDEGICFFWSSADRLFIVAAPPMSDASLIALADSFPPPGP
jgi:hypothetical protein